MQLAAASAPLQRLRSDPATALDFSTLPNCCSHEHWGSVSSIGRMPGGHRADFECGALPGERTGLLDLVVDPYFRNSATRGGANFDALAAESGAKFEEYAKRSPWDAWRKIQPILRRHQFTGVVQCVRRGVLKLYGSDLLSLDQRSFAALNDAVGSRYAGIFAWYRKAMSQAHFSDLIRPVQPEFYFREASRESAAEEMSFTRTVLRIDPFLELWPEESPRRNLLAGMVGVDPVDAGTWRSFLASFFETAAKKSAVGTKQLQAYRRSLEFQTRDDSAVKFRGRLTPQEVRAFQDWVVHECCKLAHERNWVHQVHVGTNNIGESSPLPLIPLAERYPRMNIVMIHCWPFLKESGWLAKHVPNVYIDTCWQPVLNPQFFREALTMWWNYVPAHKITCGHDSTSVEMAVGSSMFTREIMADVLRERTRGLGASDKEITSAAAALLHGNAIELYGRPKFS